MKAFFSSLVLSKNSILFYGSIRECCNSLFRKLLLKASPKYSFRGSALNSVSKSSLLVDLLASNRVTKEGFRFLSKGSLKHLLQEGRQFFNPFFILPLDFFPLDSSPIPGPPFSSSSPSDPSDPSLPFDEIYAFLQCAWGILVSARGYSPIIFSSSESGFPTFAKSQGLELKGSQSSENIFSRGMGLQKSLKWSSGGAPVIDSTGPPLSYMWESQLKSQSTQYLPSSIVCTELIMMS